MRKALNCSSKRNERNFHLFRCSLASLDTESNDRLLCESQSTFAHHLNLVIVLNSWGSFQLEIRNERSVDNVFQHAAVERAAGHRTT
jgi:hypothetical protein